MATYTPFDYGALSYNYGGDKDEETPPESITPKVTGFTPAYGGKPAVPDPTGVLKNVIGANVGMMPDIKGLGRKASNYAWNQTIGRVPGYEDMAAQSAKNIGSFLRGEVPVDVLYQLGQGAAERGISRGGGFSNADYLRSLGLTSLGLMGEGEKGLTGALQRAESVPLFDISKYMLSPQDAYNAIFQANVIGAAPDPAAAAAAARTAITGGFKTSPGMISGMPSIGGISRNPSGTPSIYDKWASQWTPVGSDVGTTGYAPTESTYNPWGPSGWIGGGPTSPASARMTDLDQLLFGGAEDYYNMAGQDPLAGMGYYDMAGEGIEG